MCSVQSSLLFLYCVASSVMSVQYCLRVSRIMCQQDSVYTVFSVSLQGRPSSIAFNASSVPSLQHQFSFLSTFSLQGRVCSIHSQWCSVLAGLQSTALMVFLPLFSVGSVQSSIQLSVGFRVCSVQGVYCSVGHSPSALFSVCSVQSTGCSPRVLCSCHVQSPHFECPLPLRSS